VTKKQFENGKDARACKNHHGSADDEARRYQPAARMHIIEKNRAKAD
jgi:hypothetical protein